MPTATKSKVKRKPGRPRFERVSWAVEIVDWDWNFMFGIQTLKGDPDPYFDYRYLNVRGIVRGPDQYLDKSLEISCSASIEPSEKIRQDFKPKAVGSFSRSRGVLSGRLSMPTDVLPLVLQMLIANRYRYIIADAAPFEGGDALIRDYYFSPGPNNDET